MEQTREKIAEQLNHLHQSAADYVNSKRSRKQVYKEGEKVLRLEASERRVGVAAENPENPNPVSQSPPPVSL